MRCIFKLHCLFSASNCFTFWIYRRKPTIPGIVVRRGPPTYTGRPPVGRRLPHAQQRSPETVLDTSTTRLLIPRPVGWYLHSTQYNTGNHHIHLSVAHSSCPQAGHLWVGASHTPLRVLLLSRPATAWLEGTWLVSRYLIPRPSFVMMPGSVLPYSTTDGASTSGPARAGLGSGSSAVAGGSGGLNFGGYISKLQTVLRGSGAGGAGGAGAGDAGDEESGAGAGSGGSGGKAGAFHGTARVLGGSGAAGGPAVPAATAAALAAEARMGGGAAAGSRS